jgi:3-hydroxybutyryl-CoA dehydrogenase
MARIAIIGGGLMGRGIAQVFACGGHQVRITDPNAGARERILPRISDNLHELGSEPTALVNIEVCQTLEQAVSGADWVVEAAPEDLPLKQELFAQIEAAAPRHAILASNTSVIPIADVMGRIVYKERALGTHWWNPPYLVPLVEVIRTASTSDDVVEATLRLLKSVGKQPVEVKKDVAGFVGNRLQHALWREAIALVAEGVCDAETVDTVVKASFGRRLAVLGPLENSDLVGTDLTQAIHRTVLPHLNSSPAPSPLIDRMVAEGRLGFKSGEGFYVWTPEQQAALQSKLAEHLKAAAKADRSENRDQEAIR